MSDNKILDDKNPYSEEDFTNEIDFRLLETTLSKEEKNKCYEVCREVSNYLKTDREKLYMMERLVLELENIEASEKFMFAIKESRKELNKQNGANLSIKQKKGLVL
ncbi:MAG TPA: hypothetical protein PLP33_23595 [Leptospiraceae bacterium]|nr:hypothetical protein [Leptospiraceae bacterium]